MMTMVINDDVDLYYDGADCDGGDDDGRYDDVAVWDYDDM